MGRAIYDAVEQARCEALGSNRMSGVAGNLSAALEERCRQAGYARIADREAAPIVEAVAFHHRPNEVAPESRPLVSAIHIASGLIEEMTESDATQRAGGANIDSSGRIDVSFLREAGLEEAFKKSRGEAEKLLAKTT